MRDRAVHGRERDADAAGADGAHPSPGPRTSLKPRLAAPRRTTAVVISPRRGGAARRPSPPAAGKNDAGLFEVNLRDERWLPFEGQGAISTWNLVLDPRDNNFDFSTVTDVILHVRYTRAAGATSRGRQRPRRS